MNDSRTQETDLMSPYLLGFDHLLLAIDVCSINLIKLILEEEFVQNQRDFKWGWGGCLQLHT